MQDNLIAGALSWRKAVDLVFTRGNLTGSSSQSVSLRKRRVSFHPFDPKGKLLHCHNIKGIKREGRIICFSIRAMSSGLGRTGHFAAVCERNSVLTPRHSQYSFQPHSKSQCWSHRHVETEKLSNIKHTCVHLKMYCQPSKNSSLGNVLSFSLKKVKIRVRKPTEGERDQ